MWPPYGTVYGVHMGFLSGVYLTFSHVHQHGVYMASHMPLYVGHMCDLYGVSYMTFYVGCMCDPYVLRHMVGHFRPILTSCI